MGRNRFGYGAILGAVLAVACGGNAEGGGTAGAGGGGGGGGAGVGGGTSGSGGSGGDITAKIDALCTQLDALPCALSDCNAQVTESVAEAEFAKCTLELREALQCLLAEGMVCDDSGDPVAPPVCKPLMSALESCLPSCGGGGSATSCSGSCVGKYVNWAAECQVTASSMLCTCTIGSGTGKQFSVAGTCQDNWEPQAQAQCN